MRQILARYGVMLAFVLLALGAAYALQKSNEQSVARLYNAQLQGCERRNDLRNESNQRVRAHELERDILAEFLNSAAVARNSTGTELDKKTAKKYVGLSVQLQTLHFDVLPLEDCVAVTPKP